MLRWLDVGTRLLWLTPLTAALGFHGFRLLSYMFKHPGVAASNPLRTSVELAFLAGAAWWILQRWRFTVSIAQGETPVSKTWALVRLAVVAALAGVLVFFVLPQAREVQLLYGEVQNRDGLRLLRKCLQQHHLINGRLPDDPRVLTRDPKFGLPRIPALWDTPWAWFPHPPSSDISIRYTPAAEDSGKWTYIHPTAKDMAGRLFVDCTHTDSIGTSWTSY
ncbi:MAG: hypothetical protein WC943_10045 [Elusimicrobiota bacterium]|jgi:hypothetical protein